MMAEKNPFSGPIRRTEIPIYRDQVDRFRHETVKTQEALEEPLLLRKFLGESISTCRHQVADVYNKYHPDLTEFKDKIDTGIAHANVTIDYLRQEENDISRVGAVAMAGMAGLILGLRGGIIRKLFYTSTAATGMAALCYPTQAIDVSKDLMVHSKKYALISYNFIKGVDSGDSKPAAVSSPAKVVKLSEPSKPKAPLVKGDPGMSNPEDKDMYTTRS